MSIIKAVGMATGTQSSKGFSTAQSSVLRDDQVASTPPEPRSQVGEHEFDYLESDNVAIQEDIPPDGGYGWVCTACVFIINAHTWGINSVSNPPSLNLIKMTDGGSRGLYSSRTIFPTQPFPAPRSYSTL